MIIPVLIVAIGASWLLVHFIRRWAERRNVLDIPNQRSSHTRPTPRGGGLAIVMATLAGLCVLTSQSGESMFAFVACAGLIALISWLDDLHTLSNSIRFGVHSVAAAVVIYAYGPWQQIDLPFFSISVPTVAGVVLTFLWIVGLTNAYNFMDGIDGIAGVQALIAGATWVAIGRLIGSSSPVLLGGLIAAASFGFLLHNWPPARIFMGDVGSAFLGFTFAAVPFITSGESLPNAIAARLPVAGALVVWPFLFDSIFTFFRRLLRGEHVFSAHRSHLYQRLTLAGHSHLYVTTLYAILDVLGGGLALMWMTDSPMGDLTVAAVLPLACGGLWLFVLGKEKQFAAKTADGHTATAGASSETVSSSPSEVA